MSHDRPHFGLRVAQLAAIGALIGGVFDASITQLLPHHTAFLGATDNQVAAPTAELLLLMLRTLGIALVGVGAGALTLLEAWRRGAASWTAMTAAGMLLLVEGFNAIAIRRVGSPLYLGPAAIVLMAVVGVALALKDRQRHAP
jgi:hypothetical protein